VTPPKKTMSDFKVDEAAFAFKEGGTWRWKDDNIAGSALGAMLVVEGLSRLGADACARILELEAYLAFERAKVAELRLALHREQKT